MKVRFISLHRPCQQYPDTRNPPAKFVVMLLFI